MGVAHAAPPSPRSLRESPSPVQGEGQKSVLVLGPERGLFLAAPARLLLWARQAMPGARCCYARAPRCSRREPLGAAAGLLADSGHVTLWRAPVRGSRGLYDFFARRERRGFAGVEGSVSVLRDDDARVLDLLEAAAAARASCPSNAELAKGAGLSSSQLAGAAVARLEKAGFILRETAPAPIWRVVTIVESGERTAAKASVWL